MKTSRWKAVFLIIGALLSAAILMTARNAAQAQAPDSPGRVVYASDRTGNFEVYVLDPQTGLTNQLTNDPGNDIEPVWSPDGTMLAFVSDRDGDYEIIVMQADGTGLQQLTNNNAEDRLPRWQPGGLYLVFSSDVNGQWDLYSVSIDGALVRQLTNDPTDERGPSSMVVVPGQTTGPAPLPSPIPPPTLVPQPTVPPQPDAVVTAQQLNVRQNPGLGGAIVDSVPYNTPLDVVGRYVDSSWLQVRIPDGRLGWVSANLVRLNIDLSQVPVVNAAFIAPPPTAVPTAVATAVPTLPAVMIQFYSDRATINAGECVTITWAVEGIKEVYYQGGGTVGHHSVQECPASTTTYHLRVVKVDNTEDNRYITVTVN
jgi:uncharacterized protein YgiM (DUF1202 family)